MHFYSSPSIIMRLPDLSPLKRMLLFTLSSMLERNQKPTQGLLAYSINTNRVTISNLLKDLENDGWINIIKANNSFAGETNQYIINWNKIESYAGDKDYYETDDFQTPTEEKKEYMDREHVSDSGGTMQGGMPNYPTFQEKRNWARQGYSIDYIQKNWRKLRELAS